jgi:HNH endonuclease
MPVVKVCVVCGQTFTRNPAYAARVQTCGMACGGVLRHRALAERFAVKVDKSGGVDACWSWTGSLATNGYGKVRPGGSDAQVYAHRVAWELVNGPLPEGGHVLHRCDNPPCVNPAHLVLGNQRANNDDRIVKGRTARGGASGRTRHPERYPKGEQWSFAKLTDAQVAAIRVAWDAGGVSQAGLGRLYGVNQSTIHRIVHGERRRSP